LSEADRPLVLDSEFESSMFRDPRAVLALLVFCAVIAWTIEHGFAAIRHFRPGAGV
jgi:hypothetical protein